MSRASSDDLPALGSPTSPTSASSLSCSSSQPSSPGSPRSAKRGAWRVGPAKCLLPRPPARRARRPRAGRAWTRSQREPSSATTCVPGGTRTTSSSPPAPWRWAPSPWPPRSALEVRPRRKRLQVAQRVVAHEHDVAAAPAVAAVGPALGDVGLAAEAPAAVAAGARAGHYVILARSLHAPPRPSRTRIVSAMRRARLPDHRRLLGDRRRHRPPAANAGYRVALAARSEDKLEALAGELGGDGRALALRCDVTEWEDQEAPGAGGDSMPSARSTSTFANAGFGAQRGFEKETPEFWREMVLTNVLGVAYTIRATLPSMRDSTGHYLITSSVAGRRPLQGSLYSASKFAVTAMGESLRQDAQRHGHPRHPDRARGWSTRRSSTTRRRGARGAGHRPRGHVRGQSAAARRRQRDPGAIDRARRVGRQSPWCEVTGERR